MKYKTKKMLFPIIISIAAISIIFVVIAQKYKNKPIYQNKFVMIKFKGKNVYPFYLTFKKGIKLSYIINKLNINPKYKFYNNKKRVYLNQRIYENTVFQIKK